MREHDAILHSPHRRGVAGNVVGGRRTDFLLQRDVVPASLQGIHIQEDPGGTLRGHLVHSTPIPWERPHQDLGGVRLWGLPHSVDEHTLLLTRRRCTRVAQRTRDELRFRAARGDCFFSLKPCGLRTSLIVSIAAAAASLYMHCRRCRFGYRLCCCTAGLPDR